MQGIDQLFNTVVCFSICIFRGKETQMTFIYEYDIVKLILKSFEETFIIFSAKSQKHFRSRGKCHLSTKIYQPPK